MALYGKAVLAIWNGIADGAESDFQNWHVHEHIPERVALPGFLRGRRYIAIDGHPKFFNFYEAETAEVFVSESYRRALDTFKKYYPELDIKCFHCHSWMLAPELADMMKPESKILGFARRFTLVFTRVRA